MVTINRIRRISFAAAVAAAGIATLASTGVASADAAVHPFGYSTVEGCTGLTGQIHYTPGLTGTAKTTQAVFTGTLSGCSGYNGAQAGTGSITAVLSGTSKASLVNETGSVTVNWPASSGFNPSNGTLTLKETTKNGPISVAGTITSGAFTSAVLSSGLLPYAHHGAGTKAHPLTSQTITNTAPFNAQENFG
jgi:hypothetical protein